MSDDDDRFRPASPRLVHSASAPIAQRITRSISRVPLTAEELRLHPVSRELRRLMDRPIGLLAEPDDPTKLTILESTCRTAFRMAISGNMKAINIVFDRLEGRPGIRSGETDPASDVAREGVQQAIEDIVRAFTKARLEGPDDTPGDGAQVVEGNATTAPAPEPRTSGRPARPADERLTPDGDGRTNGQSNGAGWRDREPLRGH